MIILVTGVPGAGKTSFAVSELLRSEKHKYTIGCPVKGIEELNHHKFEELKNCCILIDEAHMILGTGMTEHVNFLTVHRHNNLDFVLTTQDFSLLNRKILPLVGKHYHLSLTPLGERRMLSWDRYGNPRSKSDVAAATNKLVEVDKTNWDKFDSVNGGAEMPEIRKSKKPKIYFVVAVLLLALIGSLLYFGSLKPVTTYYNYEAELSPPSSPASQAPKLAETLPEPISVLKQNESISLPEFKTEEQKPEDDIVGCVKSDKTCNCYDSKARKVSVPLDYCTDRFGA